ncbi:rod-binding protein [Armatimonas sp.]|uniref:rod-binding protein n=1 Tax=Armatimonas sp. TaxID=1872638 RepID=UPI00286A46C5|nr:rod-binding protein [Armatimonas sp.]
MQVNLPGASTASMTSMAQAGTKLTTVKEAAEQFESLFVGQLLEAMHRTAPKGGAIQHGSGEEMFRQMFDQEISQRIAQRGGLGIGEILVQQFDGEGK